MATELSDLFLKLEVADVVQADELQIFGIRWRPPKDSDYQTMDEALAAGILNVTEVSEAGSVPELTVSNSGRTMVLLIAGEQLVGAKQNRVLNVSVMAAPKSTTKIPVSCVERGRWGYQSRAFGSSGSSSHYYLRKIMSKSVSRSYALCQAAHSDQGKVWEEVDRKLESMGSFSGSDALEQAYEDYDERLAKMLAGVRVPEGCNGVVFAFDGRIAGMDLFDKPQTLAKMLPKLAKAYGIDALETAMRRDPSRLRRPDKQDQTRPQENEPAGRLDGRAVESWLRTAARARFDKFPSAGLGDDVRIESKEAVGAGLVVEEQPVHLELFAE
jgi:hypothetical protein